MDAAHHGRASVRRSVDKGLAGIRMTDVETAGYPLDHHRHRDRCGLIDALEVLPPGGRHVRSCVEQNLLDTKTPGFLHTPGHHGLAPNTVPVRDARLQDCHAPSG